MAQDNLQSQSEQEIQFKKRARRRLVGAIALVLLMIILLPMLLQDRAAEAPKDEVVITIPSQDSQLQDKSEATLDQTTVVQPDVTQPPEVAVMPQVSEKSVESATLGDKPLVKQAEATPVQEVKPAPKEDKVATSGEYFVQIGVFSDPENVKQMQVKLADKGLKSVADLIDTTKGKKTRLRVGVFSSKSDAEAALVKMQSLKLTGVVVIN